MGAGFAFAGNVRAGGGDEGAAGEGSWFGEGFSGNVAEFTGEREVFA
jgi:hypothetical protein